MSLEPRDPKRSLSVFALVMITTGIITSIHGAPSMAEYGFALVFIYLLVALVFLLPSALISAELATGWPEDGGVYVWVKEAFGERLGFVAVWQGPSHTIFANDLEGISLQGIRTSPAKSWRACGSGRVKA